ncbi:hypothetical protein G8A07_14755 [Roseateles sp. DAIF2]|uniref:hypothetical protein n=1 Tax=Roseateles sp. DAIF2 TaxID=2714952 RepID=UPI0018A27864|nr:hypothetical protein [Roseateles sp. DAIF2]QPF74050.1 hypothetical protein G8A07_14755 [Roseateles sp. DAIF2]
MPNLNPWITACHACDTGGLTQELSQLGEQLARCGCSRRWFTLCCAAELLHGFVRAHLVSTGLLLVLLGVAWSAL